MSEGRKEGGRKEGRKEVTCGIMGDRSRSAITRLKNFIKALYFSRRNSQLTDLGDAHTTTPLSYTISDIQSNIYSSNESKR